MDRHAPGAPDPDPPALSRDAVRCFISFWMAVSRRPSSETVLAIWAKVSWGSTAELTMGILWV